MIVFSAITPHPPVSISGIGTADEMKRMKKTLLALDFLREELERSDPETILIISPHAHTETYAFAVNSEPLLRGSFAQFGLDRVLEFENDIDISDKIVYAGDMNDFSVHLHGGFLDHGALIPLYHLAKNLKVNVVHLSFSFLDLEKHFMYGQLIRNICQASSRRIAIIASGDLSHRLTPDAPAGYSPKATFFDQRVIGSLREKDITGILNLEKDMVEEAGECGLRSFVIMLGIISGQNSKFEMLSYESPFGVGYLVARFV